MKKRDLVMFLPIIAFILFAITFVFVIEKNEKPTPCRIVYVEKEPKVENLPKPATEINYFETVSENTEKEVEITEEILYLSALVEAEAGNQDEMGKRLVVDTVLNRVESDDFPDDIVSVINQECQYSVVDSGFIERVTIRESTIDIVLEELAKRTNTEVLYFRTDHYHDFGTELFKHGDHYFSK